MIGKREPDLIKKVTPCETDYFGRFLVAGQAKEGSYKKCPNFRACEETKFFCTLKTGLLVASYVRGGSNLKKELYTLTYLDWVNEGEFWDSRDGKKFTRIRGVSDILKAIEYFARVVLLQDPSKSVLTECEKCGGVKLEENVRDSVWLIEDSGLCTGTGEARRRVEYCPGCDKKPRREIVHQESLDKGEVNSSGRLN